jgi:hypothetical protein
LGFSKVLGFQVFLRFWILLFLDLDIRVFRDLDRFRLLIQRCESVREIGNFFDKGRVLPDESTRAPGEGYGRGKARDVHERSEGNERGWRSRANATNESERGTKLRRSSEERSSDEVPCRRSMTRRIVAQIDGGTGYSRGY